MNAFSARTGPGPGTDSPVRDLRRLRITLGANAGFSTITGLVLLADPNGAAGLIGASHPGWVRIVGSALLPFAAGVEAPESWDCRRCGGAAYAGGVPR